MNLPRPIPLQISPLPKGEQEGVFFKLEIKRSNDQEIQSSDLLSFSVSLILLLSASLFMVLAPSFYHEPSIYLFQ